MKMGKELITQGGFSLVPQNMNEALEFATLIAKSDMVPKDYKNNPGNVIVAVQMGLDLGLSPMQSLQNIAVINGRPCVWGDSQLAIVKAHPECMDVVESYDEIKKIATCIVTRKGQTPVKRTFSDEDANRAGLLNKPGPWKQYPQRMMQMRARSFALRDSFPDALKGISQAEEVQDIPEKTTSRKNPSSTKADPVKHPPLEVQVMEEPEGYEPSQEDKKSVDWVLARIEKCKTDIERQNVWEKHVKHHHFDEQEGNALLQADRAKKEELSSDFKKTLVNLKGEAWAKIKELKLQTSEYNDFCFAITEDENAKTPNYMNKKQLLQLIESLDEKISKKTTKQS
jgi:hypothetical protein